ncbi:MAG: hypothetical protein H6925_04490 [Holosporaceae bacterium]|nr:MAG: hypothetical protein H6925_04490 [Holosporaceae bacterium]
MEKPSPVRRFHMAFQGKSNLNEAIHFMQTRQVETLDLTGNNDPTSMGAPSGCISRERYAACTS